MWVSGLYLRRMGKKGPFLRTSGITTPYSITGITPIRTEYLIHHEY